VLGWEVRYKVAVGICKALEYLHDGSPRSVIHRTVMPSKILVSNDFQPQLSGLEFATWAPERSIYQADKVVGTIGYLAPEYAIDGRLSDKSDVYSFGVVLVELITGRKVKDGTRPQGEQYLMAWARPLLDERNLDELVDPRLGNTYNVCQMQAMILAAALCVQQSSQRPKISEVSLFPKKAYLQWENLDLMH
jgi:serine/threonine protein kinase